MELHYLGVLFTSGERKEREVDSRMGAASAVMDSAPICHGAERAELEGKALDLLLDIGS